VCTTGGTSDATEPLWKLALNANTNESTVVWKTHSPLKTGVWLASTAYVLGDIVSPTAFDKRRYVCTTAGTSGGSEPTWNTTIDVTTADNTVVWTAKLVFAWEGTVTSVTSTSEFIDTSITDGALSDDDFQYGMITWLTGDNVSIDSEIKGYTKSSTTLVLWRPMPFAIQVGDTYVLETGCDKSKATCRDFYDNVINFQGFPWVPGRDALVQTPGSKT
jgi:hypothetical protein